MMTEDGAVDDQMIESATSVELLVILPETAGSFLAINSLLAVVTIAEAVDVDLAAEVPLVAVVAPDPALAVDPVVPSVDPLVARDPQVLRVVQALERRALLDVAVEEVVAEVRESPDPVLDLRVQAVLIHVVEASDREGLV